MPELTVVENFTIEDHHLLELLNEENREQLLAELETATGKKAQLEEKADGKVKAFLKELINGGMDAMQDFISSAHAVVPKLVPPDKPTSANQHSEEGEDDSSEELGLSDYLRYIVEKSGDNFKELEVVLSGSSTEKVKPVVEQGRIYDHADEMLDSFNVLDLSKYGEIKVSFPDKNPVIVTPPYKKHKLNRVFGGVEMDLVKLKEYITGIQSPLLGYEGSGVPEPELGLVEYDPSDADTYFDVKGSALDKSYAVVVAGESGSGKSVYSCLKANKKGFLTIYITIRPPPKDMKYASALEKEMADRPKLGLDKLDSFLRLLIILYEQYVNSNDKDESLCNLYDIKDALNFNRNVWAKKVLHAGLTEAVGEYDEWLKGKWVMDSRPKKVAIVVDEATDLFLAEGLVSTVRETSEKYRKNLAQESLLIIITGTGLDQIEYGSRIGTNPAYSRLVVMKTPMVDELVKEKDGTRIASRAVLNALNRGTFSRVLKTNARILFRSLLPILNHQFHVEDGYNETEQAHKRQRRYEERLIEVASTRCIMDHGPRFYLNQTSVGGLPGTTRDELLCQAFLFHLEQAVSESIDGKKSADVEAVIRSELKKCRTMENFMAIDKVDPSIFNRGLATKTGTSNALKFMACFGLTCEVRPAFGDHFEELTALHFLRYMQAQGYETQRIPLRHAWPPKSTKGWTMKKLESALEDQAKDEVFSLTGAAVKNAKICFVFSQGTPTAQGGDVLVLLVHCHGQAGHGDCELVVIQCKHYKRSPGPAEVKKWWNSLGIDFDKADWEPQDQSSAGYSFKGLDAFRGLLEKKLEQLGSKRKVVLGDRIMATSFSAPEETTDFPIPPPPAPGNDDDNEEDGDNGSSQEEEQQPTRKARVWFREMLEPTMSAMVLREAEEPADSEKPEEPADSEEPMDCD